MLAESPTNVWATADNTMSTGSIILLHWNGHAWAKIGGRLPKGQLAGPIAADGSGGNALQLIGGTKTVLGTGDLSLGFGTDNGAVVIEFWQVAAN